MNEVNLQVSVPKFHTCVNSCPFCVVKTHIKFDKHALNPIHWAEQLHLYLTAHEGIERVIITGENEPLQQVEYVIEAIKVAWRHKKIIEFITTGEDFINYSKYGKFGDVIELIDVLSLSTLGTPELDTKYMNRSGASFFRVASYFMARVPKAIVRYTILETDLITYDDFLNIISDDPQMQFTFKQLQGDLPWIKEHSNKSLSYELLKRFDWEQHGMFRIVHWPDMADIYIDYDCQNSEGRYLIFRGDGKVYDSWDSLTPIGG